MRLRRVHKPQTTDKHSLNQTRSVYSKEFKEVGRLVSKADKAPLLNKQCFVCDKTMPYFTPRGSKKRALFCGVPCQDTFFRRAHLKSYTWRGKRRAGL